MRQVIAAFVALAGTASALGAGAAPAAGASSAADTIVAPTHFLDTFSSKRLDGWAPIDDGTVDGPSNWGARTGELRETSNIYGGARGPAALPKPGTMLTFGNASWSDYEFSVDVASGDDDAVGVVFRYQDRDNYYRFSMDRQRGYRRLVAKVGGHYTLLAERSAGYKMDRTYRLRTVAVGNHLQVWVDGSLLFDVDDTRLATGKVGAYAWGSSSTTFDDVSIDARADSGFTVAVVPDTQYASQDHPEMLRHQMRWLAAVRAEKNIALVLQEGDIVNRMTSSTQWATASRYYRYLDGKVPFVAAVGNHDEMVMVGETRPYAIHPEPFNDFINGFDDYTIDGAYKSGDHRNTYHLLSAGGLDLLVLNLEFGAPDDVLVWAGGVADAHPTRRVLLLTHDYLGVDNSWRGSGDTADPTLPHNYNPILNDGVTIWQAFVSKHPNVQFVFNGHANQVDGPDQPWSVGRLVSQNDAGTSVYQTLSNYQAWGGGQGYLRLFHFDPASRAVAVSSYSPYTGEYLTTDDNQFRFTDVDLDSWLP